VLREEFYGKEYALYTEEGMRAVKLAKETEGIALEGTYTGKTFAALLADAASGALRDKTVLFWNTYNSRDFTDDVKDMDYHILPKSLHRYFEEDVQPLERL
jgi:D-cysteine desulfhydrase